MKTLPDWSLYWLSAGEPCHPGPPPRDAQSFRKGPPRVGGDDGNQNRERDETVVVQRVNHHNG